MVKVTGPWKEGQGIQMGRYMGQRMTVKTFTVSHRRGRLPEGLAEDMLSWEKR